MTATPTAQLQTIAPDLWAAQTVHRAWPLVLPARMTVVREPTGLVLISPIPIDDQLADELAALGPVRHIVAPNKFHYAYLAAARERYPSATAHGPAGLEEKIGAPLDRPLTATEHDFATLEPMAIAGAPKVDEFVFLHRPTRTLVTTDLLFNMKKPPALLSGLLLRLLSRAIGRPAMSRLWQFLASDRNALLDSLDQVLAADFDRLIVAHGDVIDRGGRQALADGTAWLRRKAGRVPALANPS